MKQALLVFFVTGTLENAATCVIVGGVAMTCRSSAADSFEVSVPLSRSSQLFVERVVTVIFNELRLSRVPVHWECECALQGLRWSTGSPLT